MKKKFKSVIHIVGQSFGGAVCAGAILLIASNVGAQNLFVADAGNGTIYEFTNNAGTLLTNKASFASIYDPNGLAFDSAGDLFVVSDDDNYIHEITPDRTQANFAYAYYSQGMAFDSRGNLFVSVAGNNTIIEFTNNVGAPSTNAVTFATGLVGPGGLAFDRAGDLFEVDSSSGHVYEFTNNAGILSPNYVTFASNLSNPFGLAFDSGGDLFVGAVGNGNSGVGNIYEFTNNAGTLSSNAGTFATGLNYPTGLAFDSGGNLFVGVTHNIIEFTNSSGTLSSSYITFASGLNAPRFLAFAPNTTFSVSIKMFAGIILNNGQIGSNYLIQATGNVGSSNWTTLTNVTLPTNPYIYIDYSSPTNSQQFYRVQPQ